MGLHEGLSRHDLAMQLYETAKGHYLPSWVPDWDKAFMHAMSPWDPAQIYAAAGGPPIQRTNPSDPNFLTLRGLEVDCVYEVPPVVHRSYSIATLLRGAPLLKLVLEYSFSTIRDFQR